MTSLSELKQIVKGVICSSPHNKTTLVYLEDKVKKFDGLSLRKLSNEFGFSNTKELLLSWKEDFIVIGSGISASVQVRKRNHIQEMNDNTKDKNSKKQFEGFIDVCNKPVAVEPTADPYATLSSESSSDLLDSFELGIKFTASTSIHSQSVKGRNKTASISSQQDSFKTTNNSTPIQSKSESINVLNKPNSVKSASFSSASFQTELKIVKKLNMTIPEPQRLDVSSSHVIRLLDAINPHRFWFAEKNDYAQLNEMMRGIQISYKKNGSELKIDQNDLQKGLHVAVEYSSMWHRAVVLKVFCDNSVRVFFVDFGTVETIKSNARIRYLLEEFMEFPRFAQRGTLAYVQPINGWNGDCIKFFKKSLDHQSIHIKILKTNPNDSSYQMAMKSALGSDDKQSLIAQVLIDNDWCEPDKQFCEKDPVNATEFDFSYYEAGEHLEDPVDDDDSWLPVPKDKSKLTNGNCSRDVSRTSVKSSEVMQKILNLGIPTPTPMQRRQRIQIPSKMRNIVEQSLSVLQVGSIHKVYIHAVRSTSEFYFYLLDEFVGIHHYLDAFNAVCDVLKDPSSTFAVGTDVVVSADGNFCRARIVEELENNFHKLMLVDFGTVVARKKEEIFELKDEFKDRQAAVFQGKLSNIPENLRLRSLEKFQETVRGRAVEIKIQSVDDKVASVVLI